MGLRQNILDEPVTKLPLRPLVSVSATTTVRQTVARMQEHHLGCAVVVDQAGKPVGEFTERLLIGLLLDRPEALGQPVGQHAVAVTCVNQDDCIAQVIEQMRQKSLRFVCVCDAAGKAVALTGQRGIMEYVAEHFPRQVLVQRMGSDFFAGKREGG